MDLVVSHESALWYWRRRRRPIWDEERISCPEAMTRPIAIGDDLRAELAVLGIGMTAESPLDLLFYRGDTRSERRDVKAHCTARPLPPGTLIRLSGNVVIASPELVFAQIAESRSFERLIMAGCELCSRYRLFSDDGTPLALPEERAQLTSSEALRATLSAMGYRRQAKATSAARHIFDDARSPMEAKVALLLSLPPRLGGFGLPRPVLNPDFFLGPQARNLYPCSPCHPDLYWEAVHLDVEYDGSDTHTAEAHAKDVARAAALKLEGLEVFTLAKAQVYDRWAFDAVAGIVARCLRRPLPDVTPAFDLAHTRLRRELGL